jgi:hypothetical protein
LSENKGMTLEMHRKEVDKTRLNMRFSSHLTLGPNFNEKVLLDDFLSLVEILGSLDDAS